MVLIYQKVVVLTNFKIVKILMLLVVVVEWIMIHLTSLHQEEEIMVLPRLTPMLEVDMNKIHVMDLGKMETMIMTNDNKEEDKEEVDKMVVFVLLLHHHHNNLHHTHKILVSEEINTVEKNEDEDHQVVVVLLVVLVIFQMIMNSMMNVTTMKIMISIHGMVMLLIIAVPVVDEVQVQVVPM